MLIQRPHGSRMETSGDHQSLHAALYAFQYSLISVIEEGTMQYIGKFDSSQREKEGPFKQCDPG